jgi:hypothetical protein
MLLQFFIRSWKKVKSQIYSVCEKCKQFAKNANCLQNSQNRIAWRKQNNVYTAIVRGTKMQVIFSQKINAWVWQFGDFHFYERGYENSHEEAMSIVSTTNTQYIEWDKSNADQMYFFDSSWKQDAQNGFICNFGQYDFWIAPIKEDDVELWRYDVYHYTSTKSVRTGVTKSQYQARRCCIRAAQTIAKA